MTQPKAKGSIRGVPFYTVSHHTRVGRRTSTYALPFQDKGVISVDMGRAPGKMRIDAFLLGDDLDKQVRALREAVETEGPALLVHPRWGRVNVIVGDDIEISESTAELREARISFVCEEAADQPQQSPSFDTASSLLNAAKNARAAASLSFKNPLTGLVNDISDFVDAANLNVLNDALRGLQQINGAINSVLSIPGAFAAQIDAISREAADLLKTPQKLFDALDACFASLAASVNRIADGNDSDVELTDLAFTAAPLNRTRGSRGSLVGSIQAASTLGGGVPDVPEIDTSERRAQRQGQRALQNHIRAIGLINFAEGSTKARYDSAKDARAVREALAGALSTLANVEPDLDTALSDSLLTLAAASSRHLTALAGTAGEVTSYTPQDTLPIEVLAYVLYGDSERADEMLARNPEIAHPSFVQGKVAIEVLAQ